MISHMEPIRLRRGLAARPLDQGAWMLAGESGSIVIADPVECAVVATVGDGCDRSSIAHSLAAALDSLERRGVIVPGGDTLPPEEAAYWESVGVPAAYAQSKLAHARVTIQASCDAGREELTEALTVLGIDVVEDGEFAVLVVNDYLQQEALDVNRRHLDAARPFMLLKPVGREIWLGPIVVPGTTACHECLRLRLMENRWMDVPFWLRGEALPPHPASMLPTTPAFAATLAAAEVARWLVTGASPLMGALLTFDTLRLESTFHSVAPRTDCRACSAPAAAFAVESLWNHISAISGIFHSLEEVTPKADDPVHLFAIRYTMPLAAGDPNLAIRPPFAAGRGYTQSAARIAALAEAAERRSLFFRGEEVRERMSYREAGERAINPDALLLFSPRQYRDRGELNQSFPAYFQIPEPWDAKLQMDWTLARSVLNDNVKLAPAALCYLRHPEPLFDAVDSTGCAAGATIDEAILHGFYELVEREAAAIWWYNQIPRPRIRLASLEDPRLLQLERHFQNERKQFYLLDLTTDWEIPVVAAVCHEADGSHIRFAFGSHSDPARAANQAATELFQVVLARRPGSGHSFVIPDSHTMDSHPYLLPSGTLDAPFQAQPVLAADRLAGCCARARELGLQLLWVDLTRTDTGMPVARTIVPGMRSRMPCFAPGRLYEVPVRMGWRERETKEADLNPVLFL